jgi:hypothetical protein
MRRTEQEMSAGLRQRTQHQPVMLLADLVTGGIEALCVLLESPAQPGLLTDGPDHGMKLDDPVRVLPPGSPVGGLVDVRTEGGPAATLTGKLPSRLPRSRTGA